MDAISKYSVDEIRQLIETGTPGNLPPEVVRHFDLMELTRGMYSRYETRTVIINTLMLPVYGLSRVQANRVFTDTMNFFYTNNKIKAEAWRNIYADKLEDLAAYSLALDDVPSARRCLNDAARMRGVFDDKVQEIPPEMRQRPVVIYTISPEELGIERASRKELARLIDQMPDLTDKERGKIKRDASVFEFSLFDTSDEETAD